MSPCFFPHFSSYLYFLLFIFPCSPKGVLLPHQPSNTLEHILSLQGTAKGVVEKITCLVAVCMFHGATTAIQVA